MWQQALLATLGTSLFPIFLVSVAKVLLSRFGGKQIGRIQGLISSFCAGALLSDVFVHLLGGHEHDHDHQHGHGHNSSISHLAVLLGFATSFAFDLFPIDGHACHSHGKKKPHSHSPSKSYFQSFPSMLHCFTDGVTIAAAFLKSDLVGYSTCSAMLLHEIPHRLRDLLVLRLRPWQLATQLLVSLIGAVAVLRFGDRFGKVIESVGPFSAGGFVYLAAAGMVPEVREASGGPLLKLIFFSLGLAVMI